MPELPEVETVVRGLRPALEGRRITQFRTGRKALRFPYPANLVQRLEGQRVRSVTRRAKYILIGLEGPLTLLWHLGMTGRFSLNRAGKAPQSLGEFYQDTGSETQHGGVHDHVHLSLDDGTQVVYNDVRRFGSLDLAGGDVEAHGALRGLGPEPLGNAFHAAYLEAVFRGKKAPLKSALLDQRLVAGLGNIYVSEILHRAGLKPSRAAGSLIHKQSGQLKLEEIVRHTRAVLEEAILAGGSTLRDFAHIDGGNGAFQQRFSVYDREGEACLKPACQGHIKRIVQAGRSTFYCSRCQR